MTQSLVIGLGSSEEEGLTSFRKALRILKREECLELIKVSPIYISDALLPDDAPASWQKEYRNAAALFKVDRSISPETILDILKRTERALGREETERWAPRSIDLDILVWEGRTHQTPRLKIPHADLFSRPFSVLPLLDVYPEWTPENSADRELFAERKRSWRSNSQGINIPFRTRRSWEFLTELVGIVNLTPDSFSDGGQVKSPEDFEKKLNLLLDGGATWIDIGAESTRPGATAITFEEEKSRIQNIISTLKAYRTQNPQLKWSLDSYRFETLEWALDQFEFDAINDVKGFEDPQKIALAARYPKAELVCMHSKSVPVQKDETVSDEELVKALSHWFQGRMESFDQAGIDLSRVIFDPGIGFGKSAAQNLELIRRAKEFHGTKAPLYYGHSRKSYLQTLFQLPVDQRDLETGVLSGYLTFSGVEYLRVHRPDVVSRVIKSAISVQWEPQFRW
jgi:2-amino-4-hydroxy-6-hydroxymethyldihydropteridine diphosphokinase / dihydropteroate synthase